MPKILLQIGAQFTEFFKNLGPTKRISLIVSIVILLVTVVILIFTVASKEYAVLLSQVPADQLPVVVAKLNEKRVPFKLSEDSSSILIPKDLLPATQMTLMSELSSTKIGNIGFELFDQQDFSISSFSQKVNYQRALQGELVRAINTLSAVKQSKVILAIPNKKTFLESSTPPSASVVVELHPGKTLSPEQVRGIQHLVAASVEGLEPERVTVVDDRGRMLSQGDNTAIGQSNQLLDLKKKMEADLEERIHTILSKVVGQSKVVTRVDVTLGSQVQDMREEIYDPEKVAIRSQQSEEESMDGARTQPTGIPGTQSNLPNTESGANVAGFKQDVKREIKTSNFEVSKTVKNTRQLASQIEKISVAVLVDGIWVEKTKEDGSIEKEWKAREPADLQRYEELIKNAIGFSASRGDVVKVESLPFAQEDFSETERIMMALERKKLLSALFKWGLLGSSLILFFFIVVRPFMSWITESFQQSVDEILPRTIEELEELHAADTALPGMSSALPVLEQSIDPDKAEAELLKDKIMALIEEDEEKASGALSMWLAKRE